MTLTSRVMNLNKNGFTLLELFIVLAIISMFFGLGIPKVLESLAESDISKGAREISLFMEQIRTNCIIKKKDSYIIIDLQKKTISTPDLDNEKKEKKLYIPSNIDIELFYKNKKIVNEKLKIEISNFGYMNPLKIYLGSKGIRKILIEIEPFLIKNKIIQIS